MVTVALFHTLTTLAIAAVQTSQTRVYWKHFFSVSWGFKVELNHPLALILVFPIPYHGCLGTSIIDRLDMKIGFLLSYTTALNSVFWIIS